MRTPLMALIWERWRRTWYAIVPALSFPLALALGSMLNDFSMSTDNLVSNSLALAMPFLFGFLLLSHCDRDDMYLAFPKRLLRLPRRTSVLVAVQLVYGIVVFAAYLGAIKFAALWSVGDWNPDTWLRAFTAIVATYLYAQTIAWVLGSLPFVLTILVGGFSYPFLAAFALRTLNWEHCDPNRLIGMLAAFAVVCYLVSVQAVALQRRGTWQAGLGAMLRARRTDHTGGMRVFASPLAAQTWYEWRRKGYLFPLLAGFAGILFLVLDSLNGFSFFPGGKRPFLLISPMFLITVLMAYASGLLCYSFDSRDLNRGLGNFLFVRPMVTRELASARLRATSRSLGLTALVFLMVAALVLRRYWPESVLPWIDQIVKERDALASIARVGGEFVLVPVGFAVCAWACLLLAAPATLYLVAFYLVLFIAVFLTPTDLRDAAAIVTANLFGAGVFGIAVMLYRFGWRKGLVSRRALYSLALIVPLGIAAFFAIQVWQTKGTLSQADNVKAAGILLGFSMLPGLAVAWIPFSLYRKRHA